MGDTTRLEGQLKELQTTLADQRKLFDGLWRGFEEKVDTCIDSDFLRERLLLLEDHLMKEQRKLEFRMLEKQLDQAIRLGNTALQHVILQQAAGLTVKKS